jgi:hypothetical protein
VSFVLRQKALRHLTIAFSFPHSGTPMIDRTPVGRRLLTATRPIRLPLPMLLLVLIAAIVAVPAIPAQTTGSTYDRFRPGELWHDTEGNVINAHGGGILFHEGIYYWFGEYRYGSDRPRGERAMPGISAYSSADLYHWTFEGIVLGAVDEAGHDIERGAILERPKVIHNPRTGKFVMWFHLELRGLGYEAARAAVAVADSPTGPYTFLRSMRPLAGTWPRNFTEADRQPVPGELDLEWWTPAWRTAVESGLFVRRDFEGGQMSRDQTVFVDTDGTAYQIAAAEENLSLHIRQLTDDYLDFTGEWVQIVPGGHNEAPAIFEHEGTYYLLASGATGWRPNAARSFRAPSIWGPWEPLGNPAEGDGPNDEMGADLTFGGQSTFILPVQGKPGAFIAMFDVWRPENHVDSRYLWLPVTLQEGRFAIRWMREWDLGVFDRIEQARQHARQHTCSLPLILNSYGSAGTRVAVNTPSTSNGWTSTRPLSSVGEASVPE